MLIGSFFLAEFALESAALFSPSMVTHPYQTGLPQGAVRFVLSLRATGEGHILANLRCGMIHRDIRVEVDAQPVLFAEPRQIANTVSGRPPAPTQTGGTWIGKRFYRPDAAEARDLVRAGSAAGARSRLSCKAPDRPTAKPERISSKHQVSGCLHGLTTRCSLRQADLSERMIFPSTPSQRNGIEDARFVHSPNADGTHAYYATYTAYDRRVTMPELLETAEFLRFRIISLNGPEAENKGMALFPAGQWWIRDAVAAG